MSLLKYTHKPTLKFDICLPTIIKQRVLFCSLIINVLVGGTTAFCSASEKFEEIDIPLLHRLQNQGDIYSEILSKLDIQSLANLSEVDRVTRNTINNYQENIVKNLTWQEQLRTLPGDLNRSYKLAFNLVERRIDREATQKEKIASDIFGEALRLKSSMNVMDVSDDNLTYWNTNKQNWHTFILLGKVAEKLGDKAAKQVLAEEIENRFKDGKHKIEIFPGTPEDLNHIRVIKEGWIEQAAWAGGSPFKLRMAEWHITNAAKLVNTGIYQAREDALKEADKLMSSVIIRGSLEYKYEALLLLYLHAKSKAIELEKLLPLAESLAKQAGNDYLRKFSAWFLQEDLGNNIMLAKHFAQQYAEKGTSKEKREVAEWAYMMGNKYKSNEVKHALHSMALKLFEEIKKADGLRSTDLSPYITLIGLDPEIRELDLTKINNIRNIDNKIYIDDIINIKLIS